MARLIVFNQLTLDGYFTGVNGDISWAKQSRDAEFDAFVADNANSGGTLLFGRVTYEMMKSYWPTPQAQKNDPEVAKQMNSLPKIVFSRTLEKPDWNNTRVIKGDLAAEVRKLKQAPGPDMVLMGSGTIVAQLAPAGVVDEYQLVLYPVMIGKGRTLFEGIDRRLHLELTKTRSFRNGTVLHCYEPGVVKPS